MLIIFLNPKHWITAQIQGIERGFVGFASRCIQSSGSGLAIEVGASVDVLPELRSLRSDYDYC